MRKFVLALCLSVGLVAPATAMAQSDQNPNLPPLASPLPPPPSGGAFSGGGMGLPSGPSEEDLKELARQQAFEAALQSLLPLRPDEVREVIETFKEVRKATEEASQEPEPRPELRVETISLDPSRVPPVVKTATGHVTSLTVLDVTGKPWPIQDVSWGGNFDVLTPEEGGHVIRVTPLSAHGIGNMSIRLIGLATPITFTLRTQREVVDYRFDARIPEFGPFADPPLIDQGSGIMAGDAVMTAVLDGVVPPEAEKLVVSGTDGRTTAWALNGKTYVRTPLTMLSPAWDSSVASGDGMKVYTIEDVPVVLLSDRGQIVRAHLSRGDASYE